eukprot:TRINITY_DN3663_c4_g1_i3.p1 TRINITY_DN3663_c4_g1~~TRINITY_DN3663_c4_g1_i3.p1  ORF type:complete len:279 (+),score=-33.85 TRINITY_DN3663_c4_g1_i3:209-1045(+)
MISILESLSSIMLVVFSKSLKHICVRLHLVYKRILCIEITIIPIILYNIHTHTLITQTHNAHHPFSKTYTKTHRLLKNNSISVIDFQSFTNTYKRVQKSTINQLFNLSSQNINVEKNQFPALKQPTLNFHPEFQKRQFQKIISSFIFEYFKRCQNVVSALTKQLLKITNNLKPQHTQIHPQPQSHLQENIQVRVIRIIQHFKHLSLLKYTQTLYNRLLKMIFNLRHKLFQSFKKRFCIKTYFSTLSYYQIRNFYQKQLTSKLLFYIYSRDFETTIDIN